MPAHESQTPRGRCWTCGYRLDGITSRRCPECGRDFDPDNPKTMNMVGPAGRLSRWMLTHPVGWPFVFLAALATGAIAATTRWPVGPLDFTFADVRYLLAPQRLVSFWRHLGAQTWSDALLIAGLELWAALLLMWMVRALWRWRLTRHYGPAMVRASRRRHAATLVLAVLAIVLLPLGADYRLANDWVAGALAARKTAPWWNKPEFRTLVPAVVSPTRENDLLRCALRHLSAQGRMMAAGIVVETRVERGLPLLTEAYAHESDPDVRAGLLTLIALYRDVSTADLLARALDDPAAAVRTAAADAVGILHAPAFSIPVNREGLGGLVRYVPLLRGRLGPSINLAELVDFSIDPAKTRPYRYSNDRLRDAPIVLAEGLRGRLERMMLSGPTRDEREAAARALLRWPPANYKLRVAEWGVMIDDRGELKLMQSVLDDIPPLVHRLGNSQTELANRINPIMMIDKPVIHVTADKPLAMDLDVQISKGRPGYAYPKPDDFSVTAEDLGTFKLELNADGTPRLDARGNRVSTTRPPTLGGLDPPPGFPHLEGARQGYPRFLPEHPTSGSISGEMGSKNDFASVGIRWQSLIVTPEPPPWATPGAVPPDPRYQWWNRLRQVKTSYITSRGETERFLYYDGPTNHHSLVDATLAGDKLHVTARALEADPPHWDEQPRPARTSQLAAFPRACLFIRVQPGAASGPIRAAAMALPEENFTPGERDFTLPAAMPDDAESQLMKLLTDAGLTPDEAAGLIDTWRPQFLQTPGSRLIVRLSSQDYDALCPLTMQPPPTQLVRVGLILIELGPAKGNARSPATAGVAQAAH